MRDKCWVVYKDFQGNYFVQKDDKTPLHVLRRGQNYGIFTSYAEAMEAAINVIDSQIRELMVNKIHLINDRPKEK